MMFAIGESSKSPETRGLQAVDERPFARTQQALQEM